MNSLVWPKEIISIIDNPGLQWSHTGSNLCLDFHGNPTGAKLVVFSDGNHHMALEESLGRFANQHQCHHIFYLTTPPQVYVDLLKTGSITLGNLQLSLTPHLCMGPPPVLLGLNQAGFCQTPSPFMRSRGFVFLIKKNNPKKITGLADLKRPELKLFISNPQREQASFNAYFAALCALAKVQCGTDDFIHALLKDPQRICYGEAIHHREAPQVIADNHADVAVLYYHLALRYTRIFPQFFEMIFLGKNPQSPETPEADNSLFHIALAQQPGKYGEQLWHFLHSSETTAIYTKHGLERESR